jgi:hypothetical protein
VRYASTYFRLCFAVRSRERRLASLESCISRASGANRVESDVGTRPTSQESEPDDAFIWCPSSNPIALSPLQCRCGQRSAERVCERHGFQERSRRD